MKRTLAVIVILFARDITARDYGGHLLSADPS